MPLDLFLQSFEYSYGKDILAGERLEHFKWLFNVQREDSSDMQSYMLGLDGLVNLTDQIQFSTLIRMFEVDQFDQLVEKLRSETSIGHLYMREEALSRMSESVNAKYLCRDIAKTYLRTAFVRSPTDLKKPPFDLLILLYLSGLKNVYMDYKETILAELLQ